MTSDSSPRRRSLFVLCIGLLVVTALFGVRANYPPAVHHLLVAVQLVVISWAAWTLGASAIRTGVEERRQLAAAGVLLILPWTLFSLLAGFGPPWQATNLENHARYLVLLVGSIAIAGGFIVLKESLSEAKERFYSTLGIVAILLASSLYLAWSSILLEAYSAKDLLNSEQLPPWVSFLFGISDVVLFFGGALTYLATAAFAASLGRTRWLGRTATRACVIASFVALLCLVLRGVHFPEPTEVFSHWYSIPEFVAGIPAVPWIIPTVFGVLLLRRAGD